MHNRGFSDEHLESSHHDDRPAGRVRHRRDDGRAALRHGSSPKVILTTVAAWIGVETVLYISLNLISLFGWAGDQWVALYNAWRPLVPNYVSRYAAKRQARKDRKDKANVE